MSEGLTTDGDSQFPTVGEVHLRLTTGWVLLLEVHVPVRLEGPVVADRRCNVLRFDFPNVSGYLPHGLLNRRLVRAALAIVISGGPEGTT